MLYSLENPQEVQVIKVGKHEKEVLKEVDSIDDKYKTSKRFAKWTDSLFDGVCFFTKVKDGLYKFQHECGCTWELQKARHATFTKCPKCGKTVKEHNLRFCLPATQHKTVSILYKSESGIISRLVTIYKHFRYKPDSSQEIIVSDKNYYDEQRQYISLDGKYYGKWHLGTRKGKAYWKSGRAPAHGVMMYRYYAEGEYINTYPYGVKKMLTGTIYQYSQYEKAFKITKSDAVEYFKDYVKYPKLELLYKAGLYRVAHQLMQTNYEWQGYNSNKIRDALIKAKSLKDIGIRSKEDLKFAARRNLGYEEILAFDKIRYWKLTGIWWKMKAVCFMKCIFYLRDYDFEYSFISNCQLFKYMMQQLKNPDQTEMQNFWSDYRDYIRDCKYLDYDLYDKHVNRPKDFKAMHDNLKDVRKFKDDHLYDEAMMSVYNSLHKFVEWNDGKYAVIMASTPKQLIDEGKANNHCVAKYAEHVAKYESVICFIRKVGEESKPFVTMEIKPDMKRLSRVQCRGKDNVDYDGSHIDKTKADSIQPVQEFLTRYERWFNSRSSKGFDESKMNARYYKAVVKNGNEYFSIWDNKTKYRIGEICETEIDTDPDKVCVKGLHIASLDFAMDFGKHNKNAVILEVEVNIHDIVVPDAKDQIRTSRFKVLREVPPEELGEWGRTHYQTA
jgi:hypothetical protein